MRFRRDSKTGPEIPEPDQALTRLQQQLAQQQRLWAEQLAHDPAALAQSEPQVHLTFQQLADPFVASLLVQAARQPALDQAAKKKEAAPPGLCAGPKPDRSPSACSAG